MNADTSGPDPAGTISIASLPVSRCVYCGRVEYEQGWGCRACGTGELPADPRCQFCHRKIRMTRVGAWYHEHNASQFCRPGDGSGRKALRRG